MIGDNLKRIREELGLGVNELSRISGVNASYISSIERGIKSNPSMEILEKIANALNIEVKSFFETSPIKEDKLQEWDDKLNKNGELIRQVKLLESIKTPEDAVKLILEQPALMAYGGYDLKEMSEEEIMDLANDMLLAMRISIEKMNRK
ncbi:helix-turn-helix domain-containing protein [Tissierella praeacuta]|uniref:helix-turn-helix domain-containing protein n=1 Tax=Tissierella praeacuta TaxID=43131 RepID=UPI0010512A87|nr:helix-turn-helix transcriptional regulator [Tissierella praeacuta]TCU69653.1 DNA-binding XRE family transcriptional regulator [Tissierella praeacuta]